MPDEVNAYCGRAYELHWTRHANLEALNDKLGIVQRRYDVSFTRDQIIEAKVSSVFSGTRNSVYKLVVRVPYDNTRDLILVLFTDGVNAREMRVGTCWTNRVNDTHTTLRKEKYATKL
jgi:hypothetical protein